MISASLWFISDPWRRSFCLAALEIAVCSYIAFLKIIKKNSKYMQLLVDYWVKPNNFTTSEAGTTNSDIFLRGFW